jgi:hypothetical protein
MDRSQNLEERSRLVTLQRVRILTIHDLLTMSKKDQQIKSVLLNFDLVWTSSGDKAK